MVLREKFSASEYWDDCRKHGVTVIQYVGEMARYLTSKPKVLCRLKPEESYSALA